LGSDCGDEARWYTLLRERKKRKKMRRKTKEGKNDHRR
jgi:hypothetical protein